jgi:hypothetical protein
LNSATNNNNQNSNKQQLVQLNIPLATNGNFLTPHKSNNYTNSSLPITLLPVNTSMNGTNNTIKIDNNESDNKKSCSLSETTAKSLQICQLVDEKDLKRKRSLSNDSTDLTLASVQNGNNNNEIVDNEIETFKGQACSNGVDDDRLISSNISPLSMSSSMSSTSTSTSTNMNINDLNELKELNNHSDDNANDNDKQQQQQQQQIKKTESSSNEIKRIKL